MRMRVFLCVLMGWFVGTIHAQLLPPIYNYAPSVYSGESQNWKICQAINQKIYFARSIGVQWGGMATLPLAQWSDSARRKRQR